MTLIYLTKVEVKLLSKNIVINFSEMIQCHIKVLLGITRFHPGSSNEALPFYSLPSLGVLKLDESNVENTENHNITYNKFGKEIDVVYKNS